ncbi:MAG: endonuclease V [Armatimonadetes bacterium]|nr:endonuclease V [Armatimonadota bacterium]
MSRRIAGIVHDTRGLCAWAAAAVWDADERLIIAAAVGRENLPQPYRPGRLAYAVSPAITAALLHLPPEARPDVLVVHGHGLAHPRRFGLACHVGLLHSLPSVGATEKLLVGQHEKVPAERGAWRPVSIDGEVVGAALRTRAEAKPLYVSPGWAMDLETAIALIMDASIRYRWPEPLRYARMRLKAAIRHRLELHRPSRQARLSAGSIPPMCPSIARRISG